MPGTDFAKYHTYKWVVIEGGSHPNQIADAQIKSSVDSQLTAKGLTKTDGDKADLLIGYQVAVDKEKQWNAYGMGGPRFGGMGTATSSTISTGTFVLDLYDPTTKQLVWTGTATKTLNPSSDQEKNQKKSGQGYGEVVEELPAAAEEVVRRSAVGHGSRSHQGHAKTVRVRKIQRSLRRIRNEPTCNYVLETDSHRRLRRH